MARVVALAVCLAGSVLPRQAEAQLSGQMATANRDVTAACGRTGSLVGCANLLKGKLNWFADTVLAALQAPPQPIAKDLTQRATMSARRVVWDGTFAHPDAPSFYTLKGLVPVDAQPSTVVCGELPEQFKTDRQLLLKLICAAERELFAAGADRWPDERNELQEVRKLLVACLPPAGPNSNPCATP